MTARRKINGTRSQTGPMLALFRMVVVHNMELALGRGAMRTDLEVQRCKSWMGTPDFRFVCALADLEPDAVMRSYAKFQTGEMDLPSARQGCGLVVDGSRR